MGVFRKSAAHLPNGFGGGASASLAAARKHSRAIGGAGRRQLGPSRDGRAETGSLLQLTLEQLDLLGQRGIVRYKIFDFAHRMQHRGVVAAAEPASDLRQRA
jgi:hypothetical protein